MNDATTQDVSATAIWTSGTPAAATISATGLATSVAPGQTVVSAAVGSASGNTTLTVTVATIQSIAIDPPLALSAPGAKRQYTATATLTDATTQDVTSQVVWSSSNLSVFIANDDLGPNSVGEARVTQTATTARTATITATLGALTPATATLRIHRFAYVANTLSEDVSAFVINVDGTLTANGPAVAVGSSLQSVAVDPSGRFAYGGASVFTINADGTLTANGSSGAFANDFAVDPSGRFAYLASAVSGAGEVSSFLINPDGTLTPNGTVNSGGTTSSEVVTTP